MSLDVSPAVRVIALVGVLAALVLGGGMFFLTRAPATESGSGLSESEMKRVLTPVAKKPETAPAPTAAKPVAKPAAKAPAAAKPKQAKPAVAPSGLPMAVAEALNRSPVAVVALFASSAEVDRITLDEARAGAEAAGAAFVALDVLQRRNADPLAKLLGSVVEPPAVLIYQRPSALFLQLDGFSDRETVAQAAVNAGAPGRAGSGADWGRSANAICLQHLKDYQPLGAGSSREDFLAWAPSVIEKEGRAIAALGALPLPGAAAERRGVAEFMSVVGQVYALDKQILAAAEANGVAALAPLLAKQQQLGARGRPLARRMGAPACAY